MTSSAGDVTVVDVPELQRYEARVAGQTETGQAHYRLHGDTIVFTHTEVPTSLGGHGVGSTLANYVLTDARRRRLSVIPQCPFIASYIRRHQEFLPLVPPAARSLLEKRD
jgi:predicted GNAT family acetyltransferase